MTEGKQSIEATVAAIDERTKSHTTSLREIVTKLENNYTTNDRFNPIQKIVYGTLVTTLLAVLGAALTHVIG